MRYDQFSLFYPISCNVNLRCVNNKTIRLIDYDYTTRGYYINYVHEENKFIEFYGS
jgi:hypothetical protein